MGEGIYTIKEVISQAEIHIFLEENDYLYDKETDCFHTEKDLPNWYNDMWASCGGKPFYGYVYHDDWVIIEEKVIKGEQLLDLTHEKVMAGDWWFDLEGLNVCWVKVSRFNPKNNLYFLGYFEPNHVWLTFDELSKLPRSKCPKKED